MLATIDEQDHDTTARLELRALERMAVVLCEYIEQLSRPWQQRGSRKSRETDLQLAVFAERRDVAVRTLESPVTEPPEIRIARLQRVVEALDCSRAFFREAQTG